MAGLIPQRRRKMPKLKTKSGAKKRFRFTAGGKIKAGQAGKRHGMIKRSNEQIRTLRGTEVLSDSEKQRIKRWMPYAG
jgi:large subunit ribosomal protein L35